MVGSLSSLSLSGVMDKLSSAASNAISYAKDEKNTAVVAGGGAAVALLAGLAMMRRSDYKRKPTTFELSGGSISKDKVKKEWDNYANSYGEVGTTAGIKDRSKTVELVDVFYSLVTDIYEWGWGQSFHFSPKLPGTHGRLRGSRP